MGGFMLQNLCKKFPKICNCAYKDKIDADLKDNKTPYYIAKWLKETDCKISEVTIRKYQKYIQEHQTEDTQPDCQTTKPKPETIQTNFTIPEENVTPEATLQKLLNIIYNNCENFKDGNVVQALSAVARLINDKELEAVDVEDTMRRFVSTDTLTRKIENAKYE